MTDKDEILAAITALGTGLNAKIEANHTQVIGLLDTIANGTGRIEAELETVKADVGELRIDLAGHRMETVARITALTTLSPNQTRAFA